MIGAGGHCRSCIDVIESSGDYSIKGLLDEENRTGESMMGYSIIGTDDMIDSLVRDNCLFLITIGQIESPVKRINIYNKLKQSRAALATVIAPTAYVSKHSAIGEGSIVMHHSFVNAGCKIGVNSIINTSALIEHDVVIGNHCHISTHATVNGGCNIGDETFIGSGATISNALIIPSGCTIGAGTTIHKQISEAGMYAGSSFRRIK